MAIFAPDIGIDLGTSNTLIYVKKRGIVIDEPTIVVTDAEKRGRIKAIGDEARFLLGRTTTSLRAVLPIKDGGIDDQDMTLVLLREFIRRAIGVSYLVKPKILVAVPTSLSSVQRKAVQQTVAAAARTKSKNVFLIEKSYAAAIGSGLPVYEPVGSMVVDIGGGTTDVALVSLGGIVVAKSIPIGGVKMDEAVGNYIKEEFHMMISRRTAEDVKIDLGSAVEQTEKRRVRIRGRAMALSSASDIEFNSDQCRSALEGACKSIEGAILSVLRSAPPELSADIMRTGIHLTGGAAQLYGLDRYLAKKTTIPVLLAKDPMESTIMGLGYLVENIQMINAMSRQVVNQMEN